MESSILYQNIDLTVTLIDIPRSIESAQGACSQRLLSSKPIEHPFPSVEPKSEKARANLGESSLEELLLQRHVQLSLDQLKKTWRGKYFLPRCVKCVEATGSENVTVGPDMKRKRKEGEQQDIQTLMLLEIPKQVDAEVEDLGLKNENGIFFTNSTPESRTIDVDHNLVNIPSNSTVLCGEITSTGHIFTSRAPKFDLIIIDPPWPNRSARRKKSYGISYGNREIRALLLSIPIVDHLTNDALVAIWVTNKPAFREMVLGLFEEWDVRLVEEWIWLKVTSSGEPISELDSRWRKPYEILLVGRKGVSPDEGVTRRVLVGVPDLHSRKPNLNGLFEQVLKKESYEALEIFARNLTAGCWAWGDEALKFQSAEYWIDVKH